MLDRPRFGEQLCYSIYSASLVIKRLESEGFIRRERSPGDERKVFISLLEKGKALEAQSLCLSNTLLCSSGLALTTLQRLNQEIIALRTNIVKGIS